MPTERIQRQIDALLDEAEAALAASDWATVQRRAEDALALDSENADAATLLTAAQRRLGEQRQTPSPTAVGEGGGEGAPAAIPAAFVRGRYIVEKLLGEGGKKRVYLAHDHQLDRDVAFALLKSDGLDLEGL
ncbi:MAG TPA: hypothetical protein VGK54_11515, partial [Chloroflexota bacterium]